MKLLLPLVLTLAAMSSFASAQERTAASPVDMASDVTNAAMLRKMSYQTQLITTLQAQLAACKTGEKYAGPTGIKDDSGYQPLATRALPEDDGFTDTTASRSATRNVQHGTATQGAATVAAAAPVAPAAPRRTVGVYQQPSEPKLTCDDYSMHYFSRHPAMAAVCGVTARQQPQPADEPTQEDEIHITPATESSPTRVSPTTRLPQRP